MIFMDLWRNVLSLEDIVFLACGITPGRNLLSEGLGRGHKESR